MHTRHASVRAIVQQVQAVAPALLSATRDPHADLLTLIWGPQFDRQHAMNLWARLSQRQPAQAMPLLTVLLHVGEDFDRMDRGAQHWLRRLVLRHRARGATVH
ncbi:MAG: hypothetical protein U1D36_09845 [Hydrogenophaga sp.]|uniref:hypothetical protein n=1 Tax=Hydrogenophaga sp. TaxID=1904254 RepID=UPI00274C4242|nr:hypothetical protein [Hydrogenophaga sp.]MDP2416448.1 hypothetical protein [Hydrogenophaga sp.]MDZ4174761.1 hypothetical protein [Hydrogenophaga sp.]